MEMHQIRYFLATSRILNFTRAAEECNVAQPSLTRAIKLLEHELGGDLFRRERNLTHLTELGTRMLPLLQQCYESALSAKTLATLMKSGSVAPLSIGLSRSIGMPLLVPHLTETIKAFPGLELRFIRGTGTEIAEALKKGDCELAVAGQLGQEWERLDHWPLFTESWALMVPGSHQLASRNSVTLAQIAGERVLKRAYCEQADELDSMLRACGAAGNAVHLVASEGDLAALLGAGVGVAIAPVSTAIPGSTKLMVIQDFALTRTVMLYAVAGRPRSPAAAALQKLMRAADWSRYTDRDGDSASSAETMSSTAARNR